MHRQTTQRAVWLTCGLLAVATVAGLAVRRWHGGSPPPAQPPTASPAGLAGQWLAAVTRDDCQGALQAAGRLVNPRQLPQAPPRYAAMAAAEGIQARYVNLPFNEWDYRAWRQAYHCRRLALELQGQRDGSEALPALFDGVVARVSPEEPHGEEPAWPTEIWDRRYGLCDRLAWLVAELAYQLGWESQVVYLQDAADSSSSPHTICELRRGSSTWLADPLSRLLQPVSVDAAAADPDLTAAWWPQHPEWQNALRFCTFWTPSMPADYCPRNQRLYARLRAVLGDDCPRFGDDPVRRLERYRQLRVAALGEDIHYAMGLWFFPFRVLRLDLDKPGTLSAEPPSRRETPANEKDAE